MVVVEEGGRCRGRGVNGVGGGERVRRVSRRRVCGVREVSMSWRGAVC